MSGPKHLWSGDWQQESAAVSDELARRRVNPPDSEPTVSPTKPRDREPTRLPTKPRDREPMVSPTKPRDSEPMVSPTKHRDREPMVSPTKHQDREPAGLRTSGTRARSRAVPIRRRLGLPHALPIVLAAVVLLAAGAYGVTALLGSSGSGASTTAGGSSGPQSATAGGPSARAASTAATGPSRPVNWLGMQVETVPPGAVVVETVGQGSPGELAGLEPGDVIVEINGRPITATSDIGAAIRGLRVGDAVGLQISRGSTLYTTEATLAAPPSRYP